MAAFLLLLLFVTPVGAVKPERPDKPGGGGKPPTEMDPLVQVVFVDTGTDMVIDGNMIEWVELGCSLFPQYWAGKVWKKRDLNGVLAKSCVAVSNGRVYVAGWATENNAINDKAISTHVKFNGF